jgi:dynein heavy chain
VFQDRLINDEDRGWFKSLLTLKMKHDFDLEYKDVITNETIIFGDFGMPNADPKMYAEIDDFKAVINRFILTYHQ